MVNQLRELNAACILIRPQGNKWEAIQFSKDSTWKKFVIDCNSYEEAVNDAYAKLEENKSKPTIYEFVAIVRYNRGLGIEYKNLPTIQAVSMEEAKQKAIKEAELIFDHRTVDIREVKVRLKG